MNRRNILNYIVPILILVTSCTGFLINRAIKIEPHVVSLTESEHTLSYEGEDTLTLRGKDNNAYYVSFYSDDEYLRYNIECPMTDNNAYFVDGHSDSALVSHDNSATLCVYASDKVDTVLNIFGFTDSGAKVHFKVQKVDDSMHPDLQFVRNTNELQVNGDTKVLSLCTPTTGNYKVEVDGKQVPVSILTSATAEGTTDVFDDTLQDVISLYAWQPVVVSLSSTAKNSVRLVPTDEPSLTPITQAAAEYDYGEIGAIWSAAEYVFELECIQPAFVLKPVRWIDINPQYEGDYSIHIKSITDSKGNPLTCRINQFYSEDYLNTPTAEVLKGSMQFSDSWESEIFHLDDLQQTSIYLDQFTIPDDKIVKITIELIEEDSK